MIGLIKPTQGRVLKKRSLKMGYMPQQLRLDPLFPLSCARFLMLGGNWSFIQAQAMLGEVGVSQVINSPMQTLSGGELHRVLLARALLRQPDLLVLDEPAQGVDLMGQGEFYDLISKMQQKYHCAVLLVSHDLNVVMARTDFVVCLNQHVCCSGHPEKVTRDPAFSAMFGNVLEGLAFYTHRHDHRHNIGGHHHE
jgi:zinc transport system ATP-binding protein